MSFGHPAGQFADPYTEFTVGAYRLNVIRLEVVLVGRIVEFDQTGHTGHGAQAILLLRSVGDTLDQKLLGTLLHRERVAAAYAALLELAGSTALVSDALLRDLHDRLHSRGRYAPGYIPYNEEADTTS